MTIDNSSIQYLLKQTTCDHVFSFSVQDAAPIFKCEKCSLEEMFTGNVRSNEIHFDIPLNVF
ncbi:hypothetical protein [Lysinibacillus capsici]|uniref:hypothetical protein n=1 Tax=Lysinibacillus capsici TaxID=2115968 RepID=UPI000E20ACCE|nr:hypothetical protein [Lysinibacillus capsici]RDV26274.1 hypothetical protein C7B89_22010 [Lysinibacillus capsici]